MKKPCYRQIPSGGRGLLHFLAYGLFLLRHETVTFASLRDASNPSQYVRASLRVSWYATGNGKWEGVAIIGTI
jgi:hypothetical protein